MAPQGEGQLHQHLPTAAAAAAAAAAAQQPHTASVTATWIQLRTRGLIHHTLQSRSTHGRVGRCELGGVTKLGERLGAVLGATRRQHLRRRRTRNPRGD
eukprot:COSAG01_NODE_11548_length_1905_cov_191.848283_2_plen_99_part_00